MNTNAFQFLESLSPGAVVFALGSSPLPPMIQDGDLDGDLYAVIWDPRLIGGIPVHDGISSSADHIDLEEDMAVAKDEGEEDLKAVFQHEIDGKMFDARVTGKIQEDVYRVATGPNMQTIIEMTHEEINQGKDFIFEITSHRRSKGGVVEFYCNWASGESDWKSSSYIQQHHSGPPQALIEYVLGKNLNKSGVLPKRFCKWMEASIVEANVVEVINHKVDARGKIEVLIRYDDRSEDWHTLKDAKDDCKLFLAAYAKKKNLMTGPWKGLDGFWWDGVKDLMCQNKRAHEISNLLTFLYKAWKDKFKESGGNNIDVIRLGRAYKKSLGKHSFCFCYLLVGTPLLSYSVVFYPPRLALKISRNTEVFLSFHMTFISSYPRHFRNLWRSCRKYSSAGVCLGELVILVESSNF